MNMNMQKLVSIHSLLGLATKFKISSLINRTNSLFVIRILIVNISNTLQLTRHSCEDHVDDSEGPRGWFREDTVVTTEHLGNLTATSLSISLFIIFMYYYLYHVQHHSSISSK